MMSSSEYLFLESECSFTKYVSSCPKSDETEWNNEEYEYKRAWVIGLQCMFEN